MKFCYTVGDDYLLDIFANNAHELWLEVKNSEGFKNHGDKYAHLAVYRGNDKVYPMGTRPYAEGKKYEQWVKSAYCSAINYNSNPTVEELVAKAMVSLAKGRVVKVDILPNGKLGQRVLKFRVINDVIWQMWLEDNDNWVGITRTDCFYEEPKMTKHTIFIETTTYGYYTDAKLLDENGNQVDCNIRIKGKPDA